MIIIYVHYNKYWCDYSYYDDDDDVYDNDDVTIKSIYENKINDEQSNDDNVCM